VCSSDLRGLELAVASNAVALAAIKIYTDYTDLFDLVVSISVLLAGLALFRASLAPDRSPSALSRVVFWIIAISAIPLGVAKIVSDFYDPFDTFLAAVGIISAALIFRWMFERVRSRSYRWRVALLIVAGSAAILLVLLALGYHGVTWPWIFAAALVPVTISAALFIRLQQRSMTAGS
jgi:hypothetical protein